MQQDKNIYCYHCFAQIINPDHKLCPECGNKHSVHYSQSSELPAGTYLSGNRYIVGKSIGSGGFGITYIGFDTKLKKKILIKETFYSGIFQRNVFNKDNPEPLKVTYSKDISLDDIMHKTEKECVSLSEAEGLKNIVKVYDWFSENNTAYIITEFINGVTLYDKVTSDGRYTWNELSRKITPLMNSLAALHEKNILHRDIKPQNIMIRQLKHTSESFVLIDFGLARSNSTRTLASVGLAFSPGYSPLEQRTFVKKDGTYTDVYALAATIYFALTGEEPNEDICDTVQGNFPNINIMTSKYDVPENVVNALKSALAMNITERCQTIEEFESIINGENSDTSKKDSTAKNVHTAKISLDKDTDGSVTSRNIKSTSETVSVNHTADNDEDFDFFKDENNNHKKADKTKSKNEYVVLENSNKVLDFLKNSKVFISVVVGMILAASAFSIYSLNPPKKEARAYTPIESQSTEKNSDTVSSSMSNNTSSAVTISKNGNTSSAVTSSKKTENTSSVVTSSKKSENTSSAAAVKNNTTSQATSTAPVVNNKVTVPKIVGTNAQDAMNTLTSLNLYYTGNYTYDDNIPQGQVISQSPAEGSEVDKNSRVNFVISNGKEPQPQEQVTTYTYTVTDGDNGGGGNSVQGNQGTSNGLVIPIYRRLSDNSIYTSNCEHWSSSGASLNNGMDFSGAMYGLKNGELVMENYTVPTGTTLYSTVMANKSFYTQTRRVTVSVYYEPSTDYYINKDTGRIYYWYGEKTGKKRNASSIQTSLNNGSIYEKDVTFVAGCLAYSDYISAGYSMDNY